MNEWTTSMKRELTQQREQADERLVKRMKLENQLSRRRVMKSNSLSMRR